MRARGCGSQYSSLFGIYFVVFGKCYTCVFDLLSKYYTNDQFFVAAPYTYVFDRYTGVFGKYYRCVSGLYPYVFDMFIPLLLASIPLFLTVLYRCLWPLYRSFWRYVSARWSKVIMCPERELMPPLHACEPGCYPLDHRQRLIQMQVIFVHVDFAGSMLRV